MGTWAEHQVPDSAPKVQPLAEITARQFQWMMRYPGPDGRLNTPDDLHTGQRPALRQGQAGPDLPEVAATCCTRSSCPSCGSSRTPCPGLTIPVWFDSDRAGQLRAGLRRAVRLGPLQDARERDGPRHAGRVRRVDEAGARRAEPRASSPRPPRPAGEMIHDHEPREHAAPRPRPRPPHGQRPWPRPRRTATIHHVHDDDRNVLHALRLLDRPQGHRHPVPVLGADLLRPRRPAGDGRPLATGLALGADADPEPDGSGPSRRTATGCRRSSTTSCSRCTRRS